MSAPASSAPAGPRLLELGFLLLLAVLWGGAYPLTKIGVGTIPPITLVAMRVSIAAIVLLAILWRLGLTLPRGRATWRDFLVQAFLNSIVSWLLVAWGQQYISASLSGILNSTSPIFVFLITLLFTRHEPVTFQKFFGMLAGLGGVCVVIGLDALGGLGVAVVAQVAVVLGAVCFGCAAIYGHRFAGLPPVVTAAGTMLCASAVLVPLALVVERPWTRSPSAASLAAVTVLGVFCTAGAMMLYFRLVRTLGSMGVASQSYLRAGIGVLLSMALLGEAFTWNVGVGLAAVVVGVAAINGQLRWPRRRTPVTSGG